MASRAKRMRVERDHPKYKWVALSNTTLGVLMATINSSIVIISLPAIFRVNLDIRRQGDHYAVTDFKSDTPLLLNDAPLVKGSPLLDGDVLRLADDRLRRTEPGNLGLRALQLGAPERAPLETGGDSRRRGRLLCRFGVR